jgi:hypothetical protein
MFKNNISGEESKLYLGSLYQNVSRNQKFKLLKENCTPTSYSTSTEIKLYILETKSLMYTVFRKVRIGKDDKAHILHNAM